MTLLLTMVLMGQCSNGQCSVTSAQLEYRATLSASCSGGVCSTPPKQQQTYSLTYTEQGVVPQERRGFFKKLFKRRNR